MIHMSSKKLEDSLYVILFNLVRAIPYNPMFKVSVGFAF